MIEIDVPGRGTYRFDHLVLDFNGTLAVDGQLMEGVAERLREISKHLQIIIATADTFGTAGSLEARLGAKVIVLEPGSEDAQKRALVEHLDKDRTISIGNGANDLAMLRVAALGICLLGREGAFAETLANADLIFSNINDALDALLNPRRLVAGLRK